MIGQLFDLEDCSLGKYYNQNGELIGRDSTSNNGSGMSPYIYIIPGRKVKIGASAIVTFWTKDKIFISGAIGTEEDIDIPGGARYLRISVSTRIDVVCQDTLSTNTSLRHYQSYMDAYFNEVYQYNEKIRARMLPSERNELNLVESKAETNESYIKNVIDSILETKDTVVRYPAPGKVYFYPMNPEISKSGWTDGIKINFDDGSEEEDQNYSLSGYVKIVENESFIRGRVVRVAFYDKIKHFIKMDYNNTAPSHGLMVTPPKNARYARFMITSQNYKDGFESSTDTNQAGNMSSIKIVSHETLIPELSINISQIDKTDNPVTAFLQKNTQIIDWNTDWQTDNNIGCIIPYTENDIFPRILLEIQERYILDYLIIILT